jgi:hypothetical protein
MPPTLPEAPQVNWHLTPRERSGLPGFVERGLLDLDKTPPGTPCELCTAAAEVLDTVLVIDGPDGLPVPFLICPRCRRALDELHSLLESAAGGSV